MDENYDYKIRFFQGAHAPPQLYEAVQEGILSVTEAWLWMNIASYQVGGNSCYLTNRSLGMGCGGLQPRWVKTCISHMIEVGWLGREIKQIKHKKSGEMEEVRVLFVTTPRALQTTPPCSTLPPPPCSTLPPNENLNYKTVSGTASGGRTPLVVLPWAVAMAELLATTQNAIRKVNRNSKVKEWARHIAKVHTTDKIPAGRVKRAMRWYCEQLPTRCREQYFIVIESGEAFRKKFDKLENFIAREAAIAEKRAAGENGDGMGLGDGFDENGYDRVGLDGNPVVVRKRIVGTMTPEELEKFIEEN